MCRLTPQVPAAKQKVALVGSGIAGLSCAWLLKQGGHDVHIFEKENDLGMDAFAVEVEGMRMDVPLRVFSRTYYPNLTTLYDMVGVPFADADYSFSCSLGTMSNKVGSYFRYANYCNMRFALPAWGGWVNGLAALWKYFVLMFETLWFFFFAPRDMEAGRTHGLTFLEYLTKQRYSKWFIHEMVLPMLSVVCTCSYGAVGRYPADLIISYLCSHPMSNFDPDVKANHCRVVGGIKQVVDKLSQGAHTVHLGTPAEEIEQCEDGKVMIRYTDKTTGKVVREKFDAVVLACQAPDALRLLSNPRPAQQDALRSFTYEQSRVVVHRDKALMPCLVKLRRDWSPLNILVDGTEEDKMPMCSVWMCRASDPEWDPSVIQTWAPLVEPKPSSVAMDAHFWRPVVTWGSVKGMRQLAQAQGMGGVYYVGAWSLYAVPLLENGVVSAMKVAARLGVDIPWLKKDSQLQAPTCHFVQIQEQEAAGESTTSMGKEDALGGACFSYAKRPHSSVDFTPSDSTSTSADASSAMPQSACASRAKKE